MVTARGAIKTKKREEKQSIKKLGVLCVFAVRLKIHRQGAKDAKKSNLYKNLAHFPNPQLAPSSFSLAPVSYPKGTHGDRARRDQNKKM